MVQRAQISVLISQGNELGHTDGVDVTQRTTTEWRETNAVHQAHIGFGGGFDDAVFQATHGFQAQGDHHPVDDVLVGHLTLFVDDRSEYFVHRRVGWMVDLERMSVGELRAWYEEWYAPNNATLVVVGDVTPDEVKALAQRYFGPVAKREVPIAKIPLELPAPGERLLKIHVQTQLPSLMLGFNVPSIATAKDPVTANALRLISALLDGGYSARMPTQLERGEELVSGASSSYNAFTRGDSLFMLSAMPNSQKKITMAQADAGLWRLLDELKKTPPTPEELERVRAQVIAGLVYERDSITSQATSIGQLETVGLSWKLMDSELADLQKVTPADIQQAARTYFTRDRLSVAHVLPEEKTHE